MYPNLRYAFYDWTGLDIPVLALAQTYGLFLAIAFLIGGWFLYLELIRRENAGLLKGVEVTTRVGGPLDPLELILHPILGAAIGYKAFDALFNPALYTGPAASKVIFSLSHGSWLGAILFGLGLLAWKLWEKRRELEKYPQPEEITHYIMPHDRVGDIVIISAISGVLGAKLFHVLEFATWDSLWTELLSGSGLTIYGGLILATIAVAFWAHRKEIPPLQLADAIAPILLLSYGLGRLGCHFSGDGDWGDPNPNPNSAWLPDWLWAYSYPNNVVNAGIPLEHCGYPVSFGDYCSELPAAVYPTSVWEFLMGTAGFALLWYLRKPIKAHGLLFSIYLIINGLERFLIELIRVNGEYNVLGIKMTQAQAIAVIVFILGVIGSIFFWRKQLQIEHRKQTDMEDAQGTSSEEETIG